VDTPLVFRDLALKPMARWEAKVMFEEREQTGKWFFQKFGF